MSAGKGESRNLRTQPLKKRRSTVRTRDLGSTVEAGASFSEWFEALPDILAGRAIRELAREVAAARRRNREVIVGIGAHVIKCGLSPWLIKFMEEGNITLLAMNGACAIHDFELASAGRTSEDVGPALEEGTFGTARETAEFVNEAARLGRQDGIGLGESLGRLLSGRKLPLGGHSLLSAAYDRNIPVTVHVAIGTDITHMHPSTSGADLGETSYTDFLRLADRVQRLERGVFLNIGSAVILPEVFLKALALSRNRTGGKPRKLTTANLDFINHYRPLQNVVQRPTSSGGRGYQIIGHHELLIPLLFAAVQEELAR